MKRLLILPIAFALLNACSHGSSSSKDAGGTANGSSNHCTQVPDVCVGDQLGFWGRLTPGGEYADPAFDPPRTVTEVVPAGELSQAEKAEVASADPNLRAQTEATLREASKIIGTRVFMDPPPPNGVPQLLNYSLLFRLHGCQRGGDYCVGDKIQFLDYTSKMLTEEIVGLRLTPGIGENDRGTLLTRYLDTAGKPIYNWRISQPKPITKGCIHLTAQVDPMCVGQTYWYAERINSRPAYQAVFQSYTNADNYLMQLTDGTFRAVVSYSVDFYLPTGCIGAGLCFPELASKKFYTSASFDDLNGGTVPKAGDTAYTASVLALQMRNNRGWPSSVIMDMDGHGQVAGSAVRAEWLYETEGCLDSGKLCVGDMATYPRYPGISGPYKIVGFNKLHRWLVLEESRSYQIEHFQAPAEQVTP